ncbi:MAG: hypothetical protein B7Z66_02240 [Chromatiales bacterium 21-64-14]|nr:MAG: hypothetical protein B7Z66_02240 [Chromatiales bacterium 21-64-14]HQU16504.1 PilZ domain-containing protein [Gammaproteobacteria bacterium]
MIEQRSRPRKNVAIQVEVAFQGSMVRDGYASNVSADGAYMEFGYPVELAPGTDLLLKFRIWTGQEHICRLLKAKVTRCDTTGLALAFADRDLISHAVVEDIRFYQGCERRSQPRLQATAIPA